MNDNNYISPLDLSSGKPLQTLVRSHYSSVLCLFPGIDPKPEEFSRATLIVTGGGIEQIATLLRQRRLPDYTPILFLGTGDKMPNSLIEFGPNRLIDYLAVPVSHKIFLHRISFLRQVQKISAEHHVQTTTLNQQLNLLYTRDGLTGLFNRRHLTNNLKKTLQQAKANREELSLLILNIDYFNNVNKSSGLEFGDFILNEMAARITETTSDIDSCTSYRFSGEDFVIMLPEVDL